MNLDECRQNNGKVETKFAIANRPSDVVSRIHVYVDLETLANPYQILCLGTQQQTYLKSISTFVSYSFSS